MAELDVREQFLERFAEPLSGAARRPRGSAPSTSWRTGPWPATSICKPRAWAASRL